MEKTVYLYGSARNAATRALRRAAVPREMQIRVGPWIVRPSRRVSVEFLQLAKFEREVLEKVTNGTIQVQNGDTVVYSIEQLKNAFAGLHEPAGGLDFMTIPYAELMGLMRSESPSQAVWDAFVARSLDDSAEADRMELPAMANRIRALTEFAEANSVKLNTLKSLQLINAAREKLERDEQAARDEEAAKAQRAQQAEADAIAEAAAARQRSDEERAAEAAKNPPPSTVGDAPSTVRADSPEQMDFSAGVSTGTAAVAVDLAVEASVAATDAAMFAAAEAAPKAESTEASAEAVDPKVAARAAKEAQLPEGWRTFSNAKLAELLTGFGLDLPARQNKAGFIAAVEGWLEAS